MNRFNTLTPGAKGDAVKWVQRKLGVAPSGTFDKALLLAVSSFQTKHGLVADGIVGPKTFAVMCWQ